MPWRGEENLNKIIIKIFMKDDTWQRKKVSKKLNIILIEADLTYIHVMRRKSKVKRILKLMIEEEIIGEWETLIAIWEV
jgi:hypothetical protein